MASTTIRSDQVDHMLDLYCGWREACVLVREAYARFSAAARRRERKVAFAAYGAALDREEAASEVYAAYVRRMAPDVQVSPAHRTGSGSLP